MLTNHCKNVRILLRNIHTESLEPGLFRQGQVAGTCECVNEASGSLKRGEFLD